MQWGTQISKYATPFASWLGLSCYNPLTGELKPESRCAQTRDRLDAAKNPKEYASAIFDRFWSKSTKGDKMAEETELKDFILVVAVKATDAVQAGTKMAEGTVLAINPQQPKAQVQSGGGITRPTNQGQVITRIQGKAESSGGS